MVIYPVRGTYKHLTYSEKKKITRSKPQNIVFPFDVITRIPGCLSQYVIKEILWKELTLPKLTSWWHVTLIIHFTIWQIAIEIEISGRDEKYLNKYGNLEIANVNQIFFGYQWAKKYWYVVICPSDETYNHLANLKKKSKYDKRTTKYCGPVRCYKPYTTVSESMFWKKSLWKN